MDNQIPLAVQMAADTLGYTNIRRSHIKWLADDSNGEVQFIWDDLIAQNAKRIESSMSITE